MDAANPRRSRSEPEKGLRLVCEDVTLPEVRLLDVVMEEFIMLGADVMEDWRDDPRDEDRLSKGLLLFLAALNLRLGRL